MRRLLARLRRTRFVYRRSSNFIKTVVMSAIALSVAALVALSISIHAANARAQELKDQAAQLEQEKNQWGDKIDSLGSADSVEDIAKDELGLVDPDTIIIKPES